MKGLIPKAQMFLKQHSSTILTCVGAVGVVATAVTAVKATPTAVELLKAKEEEKGEKLTTLETIKVAGPAYIPSAIIGASTVACIFGANVLNKKQQATLASAYALLDSSYKEYRQAVQNVFGIEGEQHVIEEVAANKQVETDDDGMVTIFDNFRLIFYKAKLEDIHEAKVYINDVYRKRGYVCLEEFYEKIGVEYLDPDYTYGWSSLDGQYLTGRDGIEINCEPSVEKNGMREDIYLLTMPWEPYKDYLL